MANEQAQKYFDTLIANYDIFVDAIEKANERGIKVAKELASDVVKGQREALELGKKFAGEPTDYAQYYTAVLEATTAAQGRALAFTQNAYQEALAASTDARDVVQQLMEANKATAQAAVEAAKSWAAANPMADMMKKGFEAMQPAPAPKAKKEKATA